MRTGDTIGKYRLETRIGAGGMGEVWLATASGYGGFSKRVVLKTLLAEHENDPQFVEMLAHEARTCAKLHHPNLIEVFDFSKHGGVYLLAMEHVVGESLQQILRASALRGWPIPAWFALRVAWECCRGLESAHDVGVIHCDLSPSNVMVTYSGVTKIVDFGVAHDARIEGDRAECLKGKFSYMAPERLKSLKTDRRTDVYALGVMLYLMFTGHLPFVGKTDAELVKKKLKRPPPPSEHGPIDPAIEDIIIRTLEPDPRARFQSASEVLDSLSPCLAGQLGAYGQHDAAGLVTRLFADELPAEPPPIEPSSFEIDLASEELVEVDALPIARARSDMSFDDFAKQRLVTAPEHPASRARVGRGSDSVPAITSDPLHEPRTRVQSLFGSSDRQHDSPPASAWQWPWPTSRSK